MNYGNSSNYPMSNQAGFQPATMMGGDTPQQFTGFQAGMPSGPAYSVPVVPMGTGQQLLMGRVEESFIENILRYNKGKVGTFYFTYQGNSEWNAMVYQGRIETAGRDHIIISDPASGKRYLLMMANLDWVEFDERINYPHTEISPEIQASMEVSE
ncbi:spore coat protein GerQ [Alkalihalophilus lindianensis]|uniref:Spore coat protein GerQ n=1 Tax=Alkalihalophilus lindianensis TaxID=1630542 RepID=A0ABU3X7Z6_9BACI|nr:spore coat protein GerQ [Alkalihalophilus lindianensis]MDV2684012.1 spore coat protein GerQ [Alkalihalophilus lindianensis]